MAKSREDVAPNNASTLPVEGGGKEPTWDESHGNLLQLDVELLKKDSKALYVEAWDEDNTSDEPIGVGIADLSTLFEQPTSSHSQIVELSLTKKGKRKAAGSVALDIAFEPCVLNGCSCSSRFVGENFETS